MKAEVSFSTDKFLINFPFYSTELFDASDLEKKKQREEKIARKKAEIERQRDLERKKHVRPWDKAKLTAADQETSRSDSSDSEEEMKEWKPQREYQPMSQGETAEIC